MMSICDFLHQVTGELSNNGQPMRRFMQTFVLVPQSPKKYYVHNDIFRYQDEVFHDNDTDTENQEEGVGKLQLHSHYDVTLWCWVLWSNTNMTTLLSLDDWFLCHALEVVIYLFCDIYVIRTWNSMHYSFHHMNINAL